MALKHSISATEFASLNDVLKKEYVLDATGNYRIDLGGMFVTDKDPAGLFSALENERAEHKATKTKFDAITKERDDARQAAQLAEAQKTGDIEAIKKVMLESVEATKQQFQKQVDEANQRVAKQQEFVANNLRQTEATKLATDLFGDRAALMLPHVLARLKAVPGDNPKLEIVKDDGTPDLSMDLDGYKKSLLTNPLFKDMIVASKASGGSANEGTGKNVPATQNQDGSARTYDQYKPGELMALKQSNPELFNRLKIAKFGPTS